jgi:hypothetical protein
MQSDKWQQLYEAIDSIADARALLAVEKFRATKGEIKQDGPELGEALKIVLRCQARLREVLKSTFD